MGDTQPKICIVGAGPSGCTLSLFLSKYKIYHTVIDKATFPRDKICGDGFTYEVLRVLNEIDPALGSEFKNSAFVRPSKSFWIQTPKGTSTEVMMDHEFPDFVPVYVATRLDFDEWFFNKIKSPYAAIFENTELEVVKPNGKGHDLIYKKHPQGITTEYFDLVLGCDGERSVVKKSLHPAGIKKFRDDYFASVRTYYENVEPVSDNNPLEFHYLKNNVTGYLWIFQLNNNITNVGIGILASEVARDKLNTKKIFSDYLETVPHVKERFKNAKQITPVEGWGIPANSRREKVYGEGYLIMGDAAYLPEPHSGKGIGTAMFVAYLAMPTILKAVKANDFSEDALKGVQKAIVKSFDKEWNMQKLYRKHGFKSPVRAGIWLFSKFNFLNKLVFKGVAKNMHAFSNAKGLKAE